MRKVFPWFVSALLAGCGGGGGPEAGLPADASAAPSPPPGGSKEMENAKAHRASPARPPGSAPGR